MEKKVLSGHPKREIGLHNQGRLGGWTDLRQDAIKAA